MNHERRGESRENGQTVSRVVAAMEQIAPTDLAESWDPIGLKIGSLNQVVESVLIALDLTSDVLKLAGQMDRPMIVTHHPPIFDPMTELRTDHPPQALLIRAAASGFSVYSAHTNLDITPGGVADSLVERIRIALCQSNPVTGNQPVAVYGRTLKLDQPERLSVVCDQIVCELQGPGVCLNDDQDKMVERIAVFPGSFHEDALMELLALQVDTVICGEFKYNTGLALRTAGMTLVSVGHDVSERVVLEPLSARLAAAVDLPIAVYSGLDYNGTVFRVNRTAAGVSRKAAREESPGSTGQGAG